MIMCVCAIVARHFMDPEVYDEEESYQGFFKYFDYYYLALSILLMSIVIIDFFHEHKRNKVAPVTRVMKALLALGFMLVVILAATRAKKIFKLEVTAKKKIDFTAMYGKDKVEKKMNSGEVFLVEFKSSDESQISLLFDVTTFKNDDLPRLALWQNVAHFDANATAEWIKALETEYFTSRSMVICERNYSGPQCDRYCFVAKELADRMECDKNGTLRCLPAHHGKSCDPNPNNSTIDTENEQSWLQSCTSINFFFPIFVLGGYLIAMLCMRFSEWREARREVPSPEYPLIIRNAN
ncbi:unnamed protein product [Caenorhabditis auriculariae]|uniref:Delta-like protein n=1 Tax=Caenorhabditis auriculariae TaxID=2777116 RepID=A0A8S1H8F6_9PELO|nr:unnamed protein product [Caenorhabditis auriculariae]